MTHSQPQEATAGAPVEKCVQEGLQAEINPYTMPQDYGKYLTGNTRRIGDHAADQEQKTEKHKDFWMHGRE